MACGCEVSLDSVFEKEFIFPNAASNPIWLIPVSVDQRYPTWHISVKCNGLPIYGGCGQPSQYWNWTRHTLWVINWDTTVWSRILKTYLFSNNDTYDNPMPYLTQTWIEHAWGLEEGNYSKNCKISLQTTFVSLNKFYIVT